MWITVTDNDGTVLSRWYIGNDNTVDDVDGALGREFVLADDPEDFELLTK
jgi:hypothetical protein